MNNEVETTQQAEEAYKSGSMQYMDSREVADIVEKEHKHLLRDIKKYSDELTKSNFELSDFFIESSYSVEGQRRTYLCYLVTKKGCEFIAHKLTGIKATQFTTTYINRFHQMENTITTLEIAEMMEMEHWQILRKLEGTKKAKGIIQILGDNKIVVSDYFIKSSYKSEQNKEMPCYLVTKLGCDFLANKFTGEKGVLFTAKYVKRFHEMEDTIKSGELAQIADLSKQVAEMQEMIKDLCCDQKRSRQISSKNPYKTAEENAISERMDEIYDLVAEVARLFETDSMDTLHSLYKTLKDITGVSLDTYKAVYIAETGKKDVKPVEVIAAYSRLYEVAVKLNERVIETARRDNE